MVKHPPPVTIFPIFLCLPLFVNGMPVFLDIPALDDEYLDSLFIENPPLFISISPHNSWATGMLSVASYSIMSQSSASVTFLAKSTINNTDQSIN